jgi:hypothetical protein
MDIAQRVALRARRTLDDLELNPFYGKVSTVRDLVSFFLCQRRLQSI